MANLPQNQTYKSSAPTGASMLANMKKMSKIIESALVAKQNQSSGASTGVSSKKRAAGIVTELPSFDPMTSVSQSDYYIPETNKPLKTPEKGQLKLSDVMDMSGEKFESPDNWTKTVNPTDSTFVASSPLLGQWLSDKTQTTGSAKLQRHDLNDQEYQRNQLIRGGLNPAYYQIDHIVPLWLGGINSEGNERILNIDDHEKKTKVEAVVRPLYYSGKLTRTEAMSMITNFSDKDVSKIYTDSNGQISSPDGNIDWNTINSVYDNWKNPKPDYSLKGFVSSVKSGELAKSYYNKVTKPIGEAIGNVLDTVRDTSRNMPVTGKIYDVPVVGDYLKTIEDANIGLIKGAIKGVSFGWIDPTESEKDEGTSIAGKVGEFVGELGGGIKAFGGVANVLNKGIGAALGARGSIGFIKGSAAVSNVLSKTPLKNLVTLTQGGATSELAAVAKTAAPFATSAVRTGQTGSKVIFPVLMKNGKITAGTPYVKKTLSDILKQSGFFAAAGVASGALNKNIWTADNTFEDKIAAFTREGLSGAIMGPASHTWKGYGTVFSSSFVLSYMNNEDFGQATMDALTMTGFHGMGHPIASKQVQEAAKLSANGWRRDMLGVKETAFDRFQAGKIDYDNFLRSVKKENAKIAYTIDSAAKTGAYGEKDIFDFNFTGEREIGYSKPYKVFNRENVIEEGSLTKQRRNIELQKLQMTSRVLTNEVGVRIGKITDKEYDKDVVSILKRAQDNPAGIKTAGADYRMLSWLNSNKDLIIPGEPARVVDANIKINKTLNGEIPVTGQGLMKVKGEVTIPERTFNARLFADQIQRGGDSTLILERMPEVNINLREVTKTSKGEYNYKPNEESIRIWANVDGRLVEVGYIPTQKRATAMNESYKRQFGEEAPQYDTSFTNAAIADTMKSNNLRYVVASAGRPIISTRESGMPFFTVKINENNWAESVKRSYGVQTTNPWQTEQLAGQLESRWRKDWVENIDLYEGRVRQMGQKIDDATLGKDNNQYISEPNDRRLAEGTFFDNMDDLDDAQSVEAAKIFRDSLDKIAYFAKEYSRGNTQEAVTKLTQSLKNNPYYVNDNITEEKVLGLIRDYVATNTNRAISGEGIQYKDKTTPPPTQVALTFKDAMGIAFALPGGNKLMNAMKMDKNIAARYAQNKDNLIGVLNLNQKPEATAKPKQAANPNDVRKSVISGIRAKQKETGTILSPGSRKDVSKIIRETRKQQATPEEIAPVIEKKVGEVYARAKMDPAELKAMKVKDDTITSIVGDFENSVSDLVVGIRSQKNGTYLTSEKIASKLNGRIAGVIDSIEEQLKRQSTIIKGSSKQGKDIGLTKPERDGITNKLRAIVEDAAGAFTEDIALSRLLKSSPDEYTKIMVRKTNDEIIDAAIDGLDPKMKYEDKSQIINKIREVSSKNSKKLTENLSNANIGEKEAIGIIDKYRTKLIEDVDSVIKSESGAIEKSKATKEAGAKLVAAYPGIKGVLSRVMGAKKPYQKSTFAMELEDAPKGSLMADVKEQLDNLPFLEKGWQFRNRDFKKITQEDAFDVKQSQRMEKKENKEARRLANEIIAGNSDKLPKDLLGRVNEFIKKAGVKDASKINYSYLASTEKKSLTDLKKFNNLNLFPIVSKYVRQPNILAELESIGLNKESMIKPGTAKEWGYNSPKELINAIDEYLTSSNDASLSTQIKERLGELRQIQKMYSKTERIDSDKGTLSGEEINKEGLKISSKHDLDEEVTNTLQGSYAPIIQYAKDNNLTVTEAWSKLKKEKPERAKNISYNIAVTLASELRKKSFNKTK